MWITPIFSCILMFALVDSRAFEYVTSPEDHGAKGDGTSNDSNGINAALNACANQRLPCRIVFGMNYLSGPIILRSSKLTIEVTGVLRMLKKHDFPNKDTALSFINCTNGLSHIKLTGGKPLENMII